MKYTLVNIQVADKVQQVVAGLPITDPPYVITVEQQKSRRTLSQNSLWWRWVDIIRMHIADCTGQHYSKEDMHEYFIALFQPTVEVTVAGESRFVPKRTSKNDVEEMQKFMEKVDRYCADRLHLILPVREDSA